MHLNHVGIANRSRDDAVRFYSGFLGLALTKDGIIPSDLTSQLFHVSQETGMLVFEGEGIKVEVFISPDCAVPSEGFGHFGLYLEDFDAVLQRAADAGVEIIKGTTKDKTVYFLKDFSGNLVEIKQR